ncbi:MAG: hypothetical protein ACREMT_03160, partial [Vulcanimicrobiaceae bacterium]
MWLWLVLWFVAVVAILVITILVRRPAQMPDPVKVVDPEPTQQLLETRALDARVRDRYMKAWDEIQPLFPDDPEIALRETDRLLQNAMRDCGYPTGDFGRVSDEVTAEQLEVLESYHAG